MTSRGTRRFGIRRSRVQEQSALRPTCFFRHSRDAGNPVNKSKTETLFLAFGAQDVPHHGRRFGSHNALRASCVIPAKAGIQSINGKKRILFSHFVRKTRPTPDLFLDRLTPYLLLPLFPRTRESSQLMEKEDPFFTFCAQDAPYRGRRFRSRNASLNCATEGRD